MTDAHTKRQKLRDLLASNHLTVAPGAHDGLSAKLAQGAGFPAVYMSGSGVANTLTGGADVGLLTLTEMAMAARFIAHAVDLPVIADADTGYGNAVNVIRTVREYEASGVAGLHLEDQAMPKRCGSVAGKEVIPAEEMVGKIRAALDARTDPDLVVIARTDARGAHDLGDAIRRARLYAEAGADMVFPDALLSAEEYASFAANVPGLKMFNMGGYGRRRTTPKLPLAEVERMGFSLVIFPIAALRAGVKSMSDFLVGLREEGTEFELRHMEELKGHPVENWYEFTGMGEIRALEDRYLPAQHVAQKYARSAGHVPGEE